jgi:hypothetical protein
MDFLHESRKTVHKWVMVRMKKSVEVTSDLTEKKIWG